MPVWRPVRPSAKGGLTLEWHATVDRIEEGTAVLIPTGRPGMQIKIQRGLLPAEVRDGSLLRVTVELDPRGTCANSSEIARLQQELEEGGTGPGPGEG